MSVAIIVFVSLGLLVGGAAACTSNRGVQGIGFVASLACFAVASTAL